MEEDEKKTDGISDEVVETETQETKPQEEDKVIQPTLDLTQIIENQQQIMTAIQTLGQIILGNTVAPEKTVERIIV